jgi:hypothetical protein
MKQRWQRLASQAGWDHHPLRRGVDRAEAAATMTLLVCFLLAWPALAFVVGRVADTAAVRQQHSESSEQHVRATLTQGASEQVGTSGDWDVAWVPATWTLTDGRRVTGRIATALNARAGQQEWIWVTPAGQVTRPPLTSAGVQDEITFAVLTATMGVAVLFAISLAVLRLVFARRRMAGWQRAWDAVGPNWSRQA